MREEEWLGVSRRFVPQTNNASDNDSASLPLNLYLFESLQKNLSARFYVLIRYYAFSKLTRHADLGSSGRGRTKHGRSFLPSTIMSMSKAPVNLPDLLKRTCKTIRSLVPDHLSSPRVGIVCGSGLSTLASSLRDVQFVEYSELEGFAQSTGAFSFLKHISITSSDNAHVSSGT